MQTRSSTRKSERLISMRAAKRKKVEEDDWEPVESEDEDNNLEYDHHLKATEKLEKKELNEQRIKKEKEK